MPRIGNILQDVSTTIEPIEEGEYIAQMTITEEVSKSSGVPMLVFLFKIDGGDFDKREVREYCTMQTKTGEANEAGLRSIKRICEALAGEDRVNDPDFDTEEINNTTVNIFVKNAPFTDKNSGKEQMGSALGRVLGPA